MSALALFHGVSLRCVFAGQKLTLCYGSTNSIDGTGALGDGATHWTDALSACIEALRSSRKGTSGGEREATLRVYVNILRHHYAASLVAPHARELLTAFLRSVKVETSAREACMALKALSVTFVTCPDAELAGTAAATLRRAAADSGAAAVKVEALHALGVAVFFGCGDDGDDGEAQDALDFLLDVASSEGASVGAPDNADVVAAALEEWGVLATRVEDMQDASPEAVEACVEQLGAGDVDVQVAAGEAIALLFEKSYTEAESDDEVESGDDDDGDGRARRTMVKRYDPARNRGQLMAVLDELARLSSKGVSKRDRKTLRTSFADVRQTVEYPTRGPRYSAALNDDDDGRHYGSRLTVRAGSGGKGRLTIDRWWKLLRLKALQRVLQGGFQQHYEQNTVVIGCLPLIVGR